MRFICLVLLCAGFAVGCHKMPTNCPPETCAGLCSAAEPGTSATLRVGGQSCKCDCPDAADGGVEAPDAGHAR